MNENAIQKARITESPVQALQRLMLSHQDQVQAAVGKIMRPEKLIRLAVTAMHTSPNLQNCSIPSIINSVMLAGQLGLEINNGLGHGWLIPYKNVCTFQVGYRGLIELAYRSGEIRDVQARIVYTKEVFVLREGSEPILNHEPLPPSVRGDMRGAYSRVVYKDGTMSFYWMFKEEIEAVRDRASMSKDSGPWKTWFEEMVKKTVLKRHLKTCRLSAEGLSAIGIDDQSEALPTMDESRGRREVAQDLMLDEHLLEAAGKADDELRGSPEKAQAVAAEKIKRMKPIERVEAEYINQDQIDTLGDVWQEGIHKGTLSMFLIEQGIQSGKQADVPVERYVELITAMRSAA